MTDHDPAKDWYDYVPPDHNPKSNDHEIYTDIMPPAWGNLVFDLTDPEGKQRLRECLDASKFRAVLWNLDQWLREQTKYGLSDDLMHNIQRKTLTTQEENVAEDVINATRRHLFDLCDKYNIDLED